MSESINKVYLSANSVSELKAAITSAYSDYLMLKSIEVTTNAGVKQIRENPDFADYLQITCYWRGVTIATGKNHTIEKSIRLKSINPKTITLQQLQTLGQQIIAKFNALDFTTGQVRCKYSKWADGIATYGYFDTKETGYKIIESLADIAGKTIDRDLFRYEFILDPVKAYDPTPEKIQVAQKLVRPRARAPIANMKWHAATVLFPWIGHEEQLCNTNGYVIRDLSFLDAYED